MKRSIPYLAIALLFGAAQALGWFASVDFAFMDLRSRLEARPASGDVVLVAVDARSLQAIDIWPWPRSLHGALVDRLADDGAAQIAFDIDFSSRSSEVEDRAFAQALERADGRVALAAVQQRVRAPDGGIRLHMNEPIEVLRRHARIGLVNVFPGTDAFIREIPPGAQVEDRWIPALPMLLAEGEDARRTPVLLDYAIRPDTIPIVSYVDVLAGTVAAGTFHEKTVIVGATALELGDQFAAPIYSVIDGPVLQALGVETIRQRGDLVRMGALPSILVIALLALAWTGIARRYWLFRASVALAVVIAVQGAAFAAQNVASIVPDTAAVCIAIVLFFLFDLLWDVERQAVLIFQQKIAVARQARLLDRLITDSFDGIIVTDEDGRIEMLNASASLMTGYSRREADGMTVNRVIPGAMRPRKQASDVRLPVGPLSDEPSEVEALLKDGGWTSIELTCSRSYVPVSTGRRTRKSDERAVYTYTFRDITRRKKAEAELRAAKESAEAANRAKTEFLANMSHELRTPLNAVIGFSELMKEEVFGELGSAQYVEYAGLINDSGNHLLTVINDILDISRIESGDYKVREDVFDLSEPLNASVRIAQGWQSRMPRRFIGDLSAGSAMYLGDARLIKQMVINLLSNAYKFTADQGCVGLRVHRDDRDDLVIEVTDDGIGIPEDAIPRLTEPFFQVNGSLSRSHDGTGLGLSLVARVLAVHDGRLEIESRVGEGTSVRAILPASRVVDVAAVEELEVAEAS